MSAETIKGRNLNHTIMKNNFYSAALTKMIRVCTLFVFALMLGLQANGQACPDADLDGVTTCAGDCDDADASVHPGAPDICDLKDNDCDGTVNNGITISWYEDLDEDGYGGAILSFVPNVCVSYVPPPIIPGGD